MIHVAQRRTEPASSFSGTPLQSASNSGFTLVSKSLMNPLLQSAQNSRTSTLAGVRGDHWESISVSVAETVILSAVIRCGWGIRTASCCATACSFVRSALRQYLHAFGADMLSPS